MRIIYGIRNTLDIKSKSLIDYSLIHPYLTYCVKVWSSTYLTNLKVLKLFKTNLLHKSDPCVHIFATAQQLHGRDIFLNKFFSLLMN